MNNLASVVTLLTKERDAALTEYQRLESALTALNGVGSTKKKRFLSKDARARIAEAQKARWAKVRQGKAKTKNKGTGRGSYWASMTPEQRSAEVRRRMRMGRK